MTAEVNGTKWVGRPAFFLSCPEFWLFHCTLQNTLGVYNATQDEGQQ